MALISSSIDQKVLIGAIKGFLGIKIAGFPILIEGFLFDFR